MNIAPTFHSLNKPQKRALILRDQLRYLDPRHLNEFLDGVSNDEPPTYTKVNGVIKPDLTFVTLKQEATRFDLGNVLLAEEKNAIYRVYLVVENGQIQMRAEDPLPHDDKVFDSIPIHSFIARGIVPLFREKFQAIHARMEKINEARRVAYNMPDQKPTLLCEGETITRLDPSKTAQSRSSSHYPSATVSPRQNPTQNTANKLPKKRLPSSKIHPHISNKRKRTTLTSHIPSATKLHTFDTSIPDSIRIQLFNSVAQTAFPNFENMLTAAWNVVSVYTACGSDVPELHRAIVELKGVLVDFDEHVGNTRGVERERGVKKEEEGYEGKMGLEEEKEEDKSAGELQCRFDGSSDDVEMSGDGNGDVVVPASLPPLSAAEAKTTPEQNKSGEAEDENPDSRTPSLSLSPSKPDTDSKTSTPATTPPHTKPSPTRFSSEREQIFSDSYINSLMPSSPHLPTPRPRTKKREGRGDRWAGSSSVGTATSTRTPFNDRGNADVGSGGGNEGSGNERNEEG